MKALQISPRTAVDADKWFAVVQSVVDSGPSEVVSSYRSYRGRSCSSGLTYILAVYNTDDRLLAVARDFSVELKPETYGVDIVTVASNALSYRRPTGG